MTDLLTPRYEVIADYPNSPYRVGAIIDFSQDAGYASGNVQAPRYEGESAYFFDKYPHLFRSLSWWENRDVKDMPEYVRDIEIPNLLYKVCGWYQNYAMFENEHGAECHSKYFLPATESDFTTYTNTQHERH